MRMTLRSVSRSRRSPGMVASGWHEQVRRRLREACGGFTLREIAGRLGANHETVRRYLSRGQIRIEFVAAVSREFDVTTDWLIHGADPGKDRGARRVTERAAPALANAARSLHATAEALAALHAALSG